MRLLVATTNAGKLRDFEVAAGSLIEMEPLPGLGSIAAPDEDEDTFEGNARIKAIYYSKFAPGEIVIADDSGLEVDALNGGPGVRSARYAEDCGFVLDASTDERNNLCLMAALRDVSTGARAGRYRCSLSAARDGIVLAMGIGSVEGTILKEPQGSGGFGYDPYFLPEGETLSMAQLDPERRMSLSHRGRALKDLLTKLDLTGLHDFAQKYR
jgi:XTP/dITP diphosphohydrolase